MVAGGCGGACLCLIGAPFDVVKVRQQTVPGIGAYQASCSILSNEGLRGFWRGVKPPLAASVPQFAIVFAVYDAARRGISHHTGRPTSDPRDSALAGAMVAVPTTFVYTPVDRIKCVLQADGRRIAAGQPARYKSAVECAVQLWRGGSLYRGFWITLMRDTPAWATYFATFSAVKGALSASAPLDGEAALTPLSSIVAGGLAGSATWAVCIPMDTIKTVFQSDGTHRTYRAACSAIVRSSGVGGFFAGFSTIVLGGIPRDAACFAGTEAAQRALTLWRKGSLA